MAPSKLSGRDCVTEFNDKVFRKRSIKEIVGGEEQSILHSAV